eukprot:8850581-Pyramimonas_sp.AAC.1
MGARLRAELAAAQAAAYRARLETPLRGNSEDRQSHASILGRVGRLGHRTILRVARLRYLVRLVSCAPSGPL